LSGLDPKQVTNIPAAVKNARAFAAEIVALLKAPANAAAEQVA
jgi:hypothetical protein